MTADQHSLVFAIPDSPLPVQIMSAFYQSHMNEHQKQRIFELLNLEKEVTTYKVLELKGAKLGVPFVQEETTERELEEEWKVVYHSLNLLKKHQLDLIKMQEQYRRLQETLTPATRRELRREMIEVHADWLAGSIAGIVQISFLPFAVRLTSRLYLSQSPVADHASCIMVGLPFSPMFSDIPGIPSFQITQVEKDQTPFSTSNPPLIVLLVKNAALGSIFCEGLLATPRPNGDQEIFLMCPSYKCAAGMTIPMVLRTDTTESFNSKDDCQKDRISRFIKHCREPLAHGPASKEHGHGWSTVPVTILPETSTPNLQSPFEQFTTAFFLLSMFYQLPEASGEEQGQITELLKLRQLMTDFKLLQANSPQFETPVVTPHTTKEQLEEKWANIFKSHLLLKKNQLDLVEVTEEYLKM
ncbi:hypothetical protein T439DRAFT_355055 [Meredithblackwellia eburnea MCA 4105]